MMPLPEVLTVADVLARYGLRDRPAARKVMREAGAFVVAGRLVVRVDDLDAQERRLAAASRSAQQSTQAPRRPRTRQRSRHDAEPLARDWWRTAETAES